MSQKNSFYDVTGDIALLQVLEANHTLREYAGKFLLHGGILAGHSDGQLDASEIDYLADALSPFMEDTEDRIARVTSPEEAIAGYAEAMGYLKVNGHEVRMDLFRVLAAIVAADGVLDQDELKFMQNTAIGMGIPSQVGKDILQRAFSKDPDSLL